MENFVERAVIERVRPEGARRVGIQCGSREVSLRLEECSLSLGERRGVGVDMELKSPSEACLCASPLNAVFLRVLTSVLFNLTHSFTPLDYFCFDHCQVHFQSIHLSAPSDCLIEVQVGDVQH